MKHFWQARTDITDTASSGPDIVLEVHPTRWGFFTMAMIHLVAFYATITVSTSANLVTLLWVLLALSLVNEYRLSRHTHRLYWRSNNLVTQYHVRLKAGGAQQIRETQTIQLTRQCYQCHFFVLLDGRCDDGTHREIMIWRDTIANADYRMLRFRLGMLSGSGR